MSMSVTIYLNERKEENILVKDVGLEVVPRGLYEIDGVVYEYVGQPKFIIQNKGAYFNGASFNAARLVRVELVVRIPPPPIIDIA